MSYKISSYETIYTDGGVSYSAYYKFPKITGIKIKPFEELSEMQKHYIAMSDTYSIFNKGFERITSEHILNLVRFGVVEVIVEKEDKDE